jgi:hypothetical protein
VLEHLDFAVAGMHPSPRPGSAPVYDLLNAWQQASNGHLRFYDLTIILFLRPKLFDAWPML